MARRLGWRLLQTTWLRPTLLEHKMASRKTYCIPTFRQTPYTSQFVGDCPRSTSCSVLRAPTATNDRQRAPTTNHANNVLFELPHRASGRRTSARATPRRRRPKCDVGRRMRPAAATGRRDCSPGGGHTGSASLQLWQWAHGLCNTPALAVRTRALHRARPAPVRVLRDHCWPLGSRRPCKPGGRRTAAPRSPGPRPAASSGGRRRMGSYRAVPPTPGRNPPGLLLSGLA